MFQTNPNVVDSDSDSLDDGREVNVYGSDPNTTDTDSDGLLDGDEIGTYFTHPNNTDSDSDGLPDYDEIYVTSTNATSPDTDNDVLSDYDEINTTLTNPNNADTDGDGLADNDEISIFATDPNNPDTDNDGVSDGLEDPDIDGISNAMEVNTLQTDPLDTDSDGDTLADGDEVSVYSTNPNSPDSDDDTLSDSAEINTTLTNPNNADTDGDGLADNDEITMFQTNPNVVDSVNIWAVPTISYKNDGLPQIFGIKASVIDNNYSIKVIIDEGRPTQKIFRSNNTVADMTCSSSSLISGLSSGPSALRCTLSLDKSQFTAAMHTVKVELLMNNSTSSKVIGFTLVSNPKTLGDAVMKSFNSPTAVRKASSYNTLIVERNDGSRNVGGHWLKIYLSNDNVKDATDKIVGQKYISYLSKGSSQVMGFKVTIPSNYESGPAFMIAVVDSENVIGETNETNNFLIRPIRIM
jgi:hypothetical protein